MIVRRRPPQEIVRARKWEIARRYFRKAKVGKRTRSMAAIRLAELTRWLDDTHGAGTELDPGNDAVAIARIFAHHMGALPDSSRRITAWLSDRAPWIKGAERERLISEATQCPLKWSADKLAWKIGLTDAKRTELKITTIGAIDCSREQRAERRKAKRKELMRLLRKRQRQARVNTI